jgi:hypothetical protein
MVVSRHQSALGISWASAEARASDEIRRIDEPEKSEHAGILIAPAHSDARQIIAETDQFI